MPRVSDRDRRIVLQALPETPKREGVPTATVFPCASDLKTDLFVQATNTLLCKLVTVFGVNSFASHEVNIKVRVLDAYMLALACSRGGSRSETQ